MKNIAIGISQPAGRLIMISQYKAYARARQMKGDSAAACSQDTYARANAIYSLFDGCCWLL